MLAADPDITRLRHWRLRHLGGCIFVVLPFGGGLFAGQDVQELVGVEAGERQIEVGFLKLRKFDA